MQKRVTIKDVAAQVGVSASTVSIVLNDKQGCNIPDSTRQRILEAVRALDYNPDYVARSLVMKKTDTIGVIVPDISNTFFSDTIKVIQRMLDGRGYAIVLCNSDEKLENDLKNVKLLASRKVDGLIVTPSAETMRGGRYTELYALLKKTGKPFVLLDRYFDESANKVMVDNTRAGYEVTEYLLSKGHRRIACIGGPQELSSAANRLAGYKAALAAHGIPADEALIACGPYDTAWGYAAAQKLLSQNVTAIFASNDLQAYGVIACAKERGVKIPKELSLVGFDDLTYSSLLDVPLTTVRQPIEELARQAADILLAAIEGEEEQPREVRLQPELVVRGTVTAPCGMAAAGTNTKAEDAKENG